MEIIPRLGGNKFFVQAGRQHGRQRVEIEANSRVINIASCTKWNGPNVSFLAGSCLSSITASGQKWALGGNPVCTCWCVRSKHEQSGLPEL